MAFRRADIDIPEYVTFPEDLDKLGFTISIPGQVTDKETGKLFKFTAYEKESTNQQRYHAVHKAVRKQVHRILTAYNVKPLYMWEDDENLNVTLAKPTSPSVSILSSPSFSQDEEKELYLVVGDSKQDLGILSRQTITNQGGLYTGSVLGLIAALRGKQMPDMVGKSDVAECRLPATVVCNPGELIWSHKNQECTSAVTWYDQKRETGFADQYRVIDKHNQIRGHEDPKRHVAFCLRAYLEYAAGPKTHVHIITIGDGSANVLAHLNAVYTNEKEKAKIANIKIDIAMVSPTHNNDFVTDLALKQFLAKRGRIWESHSLPKGTLLADVAPELRSPKLPPTTQQADNKALDSGNDDSESECDLPDTPPGELSKRNEPAYYFRGPGLTMPLKKRLPVAEEPKADDEKGADTLSVALAGVSLGESSLCQKFSAGIENTADMIFPKVMGDVLKFFKEMRDV